MIRNRLGVTLIILMLFLLAINSAFAYDINGDLGTPVEEINENLNAPIGDVNKEWDVPFEDINEDSVVSLEDNQLSQDTSTFADLNETISEDGPNYDFDNGSDDGTIEAICDPANDFFLGVQWHPETFPKEESDKIFKRLIRTKKTR